MNDSKKKVKLTIKWILIVCLSAFLLSSFCFFIDMIYIPLGFIIGMIISIINLIILYEFSYYLTRPNSNYRFLSFLSYFIRSIMINGKKMQINYVKLKKNKILFKKMK